MILHWEPSKHCNCCFGDLFCDIPGVEVRDYNEIYSDEKRTPPIDIDNVPKEAFTVYSPDYVQFKHEVIRGGRGMIAYDRNIDLSPYFKQIVPLPHIKEEIVNFVEENDIKNTVGIHFRGTDKGNNPWYDRYIGLIRGTKSKILLCTDSEEMEQKISNDSGVERIISYKKSAWTQKLDILPWRCSPEEGYSLIKRNLKTLEQAVIDMWLLSKAKVVVYGIGTFGVCASAINHVPKVPIALKENNLFLFYHSVDMENVRKEQEVLDRVTKFGGKVLV